VARAKGLHTKSRPDTQVNKTFTNCLIIPGGEVRRLRYLLKDGKSGGGELLKLLRDGCASSD
jgi:hypothetical protein